MTLNINKSIGKEYTWQQLVNMFPDRWVALSDYELDGGDLKRAILRAVCTESTMTSEAYKLKAAGHKIYWKRTTELQGANVLWQDK